MALSTDQYGYLIDPLVPITDATGRTIKDGFIRVYIAGSSTPVITYRNFDESVNEKTIELDNSGRCKYPVIVNKSLAYKVVVYDAQHSQETPIITVDKMFAIGASVTVGAGATVVTGLDGLTTKPDGFVNASVVGTDGYVALDHTLVEDDLNTDAKVTAVEEDRYIPLLNEDVNDPDSKMTLGRLWQWVLGKIKSLSTTITTFRTGDVIPVDGPSGTAKMNASLIATTDKLFALGDSVWNASTYASLDDLPYGSVYIQGEIANKPTYGRACVITYTDRRDGNKSQIYTALDGSNISFIRSKLNGTWNDWIKILSSFDFDGLLNFISSSTRTALKKEELLYTPSKFIGGYSAVVETNADYTMTSPIKVKQGETLMVQMSAGYQNAIAVFASYNSSTDTYSVIQRCPDSSQKVQFFFYRNSSLNEVEVVISMNRKYKPSSAYILSETSKVGERPSLSCLDSFAGVGDSYTAGSVDVSGTLQDFGNKYSWVKVLGKNCGIPDSRVYAVQGYTTRHAKERIIPAINADTPVQMYALCYGINDSGRSGYGMSYLGTPSDMDFVDYTQSSDTFYGNYYYCIKALQAHAPKAFLVMIMPASFSVTNSNPVYRSFREACVNIAAAAGIPCLDTSELYSNPIWTGMNNGHPTITGYSQQAVYYRNAIESIIGPHSFDIML